MSKRIHLYGRFFLPILIGIFLVALCVVGVRIHAPDLPQAPVTDPAGAVRQLSGIIRARGVDDAQAFFLTHFFSYSDNNRHYLGHLIGEHIYKTYGLQGIQKCYSRIEFGCIHGFLLTGFLSRGNPFLDDVIRICTKDVPEGCMHGLGHAFLLIRGYTPENLRLSTNACMALATSTGQKEQCVQGVYMEYNDRFLVGGSITANSFAPREFDPKHPYAPCDTQPILLAPICYRELVLYWSNISSITWEQVSRLCDGLTGANRYECFWSFGGLMAGDNKEIDIPLADCISWAQHDLSACLKGAVLSVGFQSQKPVSDFCPLLPDAVGKECAVW